MTNGKLKRRSSAFGLNAKASPSSLSVTPKYFISMVLAMGISQCCYSGAEGADTGALNISDLKIRTVFSHERDRCQTVDVPDAPARAFRRSDGEVVVIASHYVNTELVGHSTDALKKTCNIVYLASRNPDPARSDYLTWIASTWTFDGKNVFALGHNEFHGNEVPGRCSFKDLSSCWYNTIVLLSSHDGGASFERVDKDEGRAVIAPSFTSKEAEGEARGYFNPTNIIKVGDYVYALVGYNGLTKRSHGLCLARAKDPSKIDDWEVYVGGSYRKSASRLTGLNSENSARLFDTGGIRRRSGVYQPGSWHGLVCGGLDERYP